MMLTEPSDEKRYCGELHNKEAEECSQKQKKYTEKQKTSLSLFSQDNEDSINKNMKEIKDLNVVINLDKSKLEIEKKRIILESLTKTIQKEEMQNSLKFSQEYIKFLSQMQSTKRKNNKPASNGVNLAVRPSPQQIMPKLIPMNQSPVSTKLDSQSHFIKNLLPQSMLHNIPEQNQQKPQLQEENENKNQRAFHPCGITQMQKIKQARQDFITRRNFPDIRNGTASSSKRGFSKPKMKAPNPICPSQTTPMETVSLSYKCPMCNQVAKLWGLEDVRHFSRVIPSTNSSLSTNSTAHILSSLANQLD